MPGRFNISTFFEDPAAVARMVSAEEIFSLINRRVAVPPMCVALAWGDSPQPTLLPSGRQVEADQVKRALFVRTAEFPLAYEIGGLASKDGFELTASVSLSLQVVPQKAELDAFVRAVLGSGREVTTTRLREHCEEAVRTAISRFTRGRDAAELIGGDASNLFDAELAEQFKPLGFASGLALGRDVRLTLASKDYSVSREHARHSAVREKQRQAEEAARQAAATARARHMGTLHSMLEKVKAMSAEGGVRVEELIRTFSPDQRGELYRGLLSAQEPVRPTEAVLVVAGDELLWIDPRSPKALARRVSLKSELGPLRSIRVQEQDGKATLLVGARTGVHLLSGDGETQRSYSFTTERSLRSGVNSATVLGDRLYATHSEVGLISWSLASQESENLFGIDAMKDWPTFSSVRDVQVDGTRHVWFAVDRRIVRQPVEGAPRLTATAGSAVETLLVQDGCVIAGLRDGSIARWEASSLCELEAIRPASGGPVDSIGWLAGGGVPRLVIAERRPHLLVQVIGDASHVAYRANQIIRWGFAAEDFLVGVNDRRDQVLIWKIEVPEEPATIISIGQLCGHSIQDVAMLSSVNAVSSAA